MTTKDMEEALYNYLAGAGTYLCKEVMMPYPTKNEKRAYTKERVDYLKYEKSSKNWSFYELKLSVSDFRSEHKKTFLGHYNYFVMPLEVYEKVKNDIPKEIGVLIVEEHLIGSFLGLVNNVYSIKRCQKQVPKIDHNALFFAFMQSLSRENEKLVKLLAKERKIKNEKSC